MNSGNEANLVAADIENRKPLHLVSTWKNGSQLYKIGNGCMLDNSIPGIKSSPAIWMLRGKINQALSSYDMHVYNISRFEILSTE